MKTNYCDYTSKEFIDKYNNLEYGDYYTEIMGNTFFIKKRIKVTFYEKFALHIPDTRVVSCCVMIKAHEQTIIDLLIGFNFNAAYEWLNEE